eukprot:1782402-Alexandrium_andersonii.AAC.1
MRSASCRTAARPGPVAQGLRSRACAPRGQGPCQGRNWRCAPQRCRRRGAGGPVHVQRPQRALLPLGPRGRSARWPAPRAPAVPRPG